MLMAAVTSVTDGEGIWGPVPSEIALPKVLTDQEVEFTLDCWWEIEMRVKTLSIPNPPAYPRRQGEDRTQPAQASSVLLVPLPRARL